MKFYHIGVCEIGGSALSKSYALRRRPLHHNTIRPRSVKARRRQFRTNREALRKLDEGNDYQGLLTQTAPRETRARTIRVPGNLVGDTAKSVKVLFGRKGQAVVNTVVDTIVQVAVVFRQDPMFLVLFGLLVNRVDLRLSAGGEDVCVGLQASHVEYRIPETTGERDSKAIHAVGPLKYSRRR